MGIAMRWGAGSQAERTEICNSFNGDGGLNPHQVVGMRRTGSGAGGQDLIFHPESPMDSSCRIGQGKVLVAWNHTSP